MHAYKRTHKHTQAHAQKHAQHMRMHAHARALTHTNTYGVCAPRSCPAVSNANPTTIYLFFTTLNTTVGAMTSAVTLEAENFLSYKLYPQVHVIAYFDPARDASTLQLNSSLPNQLIATPIVQPSPAIVAGKLIRIGVTAAAGLATGVVQDL